MYHRISAKKLNRTKEHRKALFKNMCRALVESEQIKTTLPKAKALRPIFEKLVTKAKNPSLHNRRQLISQLQDAGLADKLIKDLAVRHKDRKGGYTRIVKAGFRYGDNAPMAILELADFDPVNFVASLSKSASAEKQQPEA